MNQPFTGNKKNELYFYSMMKIDKSKEKNIRVQRGR